VSDTADVVDLVVQAAALMRSDGSARWLVVRDGRVIAETAHPAPHWYFHEGCPASADRVVPKRDASPDLLDAWLHAPARYLAAYKTAAGHESRVYLDVASTDDDLLAWFCKRFRNDGDLAVLSRSRPEMLTASTRHATALGDWEEDVDEALADDLAWWADQVLGSSN
jgi:hypothetical protein